MKIIQVSAFFNPHVGGSERYCYQLSKHLAERGHEIHVITSNLDKSVPLEIPDGFYVHKCTCFGMLWGINPATFIMHKLVKEQADVIHAHSYIFLTTNQAAFAKKLNGHRLLVHLHGGIEAVSPTYDFLTQLKLKIKRTIYDSTIGKWTIKAADAVASVSKHDIELAKKVFELDKNKLYWIPNAISVDKFNGNKRSEGNNVTFIGRLEPWKGVDLFLKIAELVSRERNDVNFLIVGGGSLNEYVKVSSCRCLNSRIKILGQVAHDKIPEVLANTSVLVLPSYIEGVPTVCLEALASNVPVVASDIGGVSEVVIDGKTGHLCPRSDAKLFAEKVLNILCNEGLRRRMGNNGRALIEQHYSYEKVVKMVEKIYEKISY